MKLSTPLALTTILALTATTFPPPFTRAGVIPAGERSRTAVILVPGAFHKAEVYGKVKSLLHDAGYDQVHAVDLPSVGKVTTRDADTGVVRGVLAKQLRQGKNVVIVGNSYGATIIGEVVKDFRDRSQSALYPGNIISLIFLSGYIPYITEVTQPGSRPDIRQVAPPFFRFPNEDKVYWDNDLRHFPPQNTFYNLLSPNKADWWSKKLEFSAFDALNATATYIPYTGDFRCVYVIGQYDNAVPPAWAQTFIDQPGAEFEVEILHGDHTPMLSIPSDVVRLIRKYAGEN